MTPISSIFHALKTRGPLTRDQLREYTGQPLLVLDPLLIELCSKGLLEVDEKTARFYVVRPLFPPMSEEERRGVENQNWKIESIQGEGAAYTSILPSNHPLEKYLPHGWDQYAQMNCVGMASAILQQVNYLFCTKDYPRDDEIANYKPNLQAKASSCTLTYDKWYHSVFSGWWAYKISQIVGNVTGVGSYSSASIKAMKQYGGVTWDCCYTPKNQFCELYYPFSLEELKEIASDHKIEGYAEGNTWSGLKQAILSGGGRGVIMPINMWEASPDADGNLRMGGKIIGSHALPWLFVDLEKDRVGCWNSWGPTYPQVTWINQEYWSQNAGRFYTYLDTNEVLIARQLYTLFTVTSNAPCRFTVNGEERPETLTFSCMLEKGKEHTIKAVPLTKEDWVEPEQVRTVTTQQDRISVEFTFTRNSPIPKPGGMPAWARALFDWLKKKLKLG